MATDKATPTQYSVDLRELLESGCHFGHQVRRWNPRMEPYIYTARDGVHIFDLAITAEKIVEAMTFVREWVASGKDIVFVGTKRQASAIVREEATQVGAPFVTVRWLGGTLTNWDEMKKRIKKLKRMKKEREEGKYKTYTKKEQVLIDRDIARLERFFGGIADLPNGPEALFVVDTHRESSAIKEAVIRQIPVVGMVDSNGNPDDISHVIPVNDDAVRSIKLIVSSIARAYADGKAMRKNSAPAKKEVKPVDARASVNLAAPKPKPAVAKTEAKKPVAKTATKKAPAPKKAPAKKSTKAAKKEAK